MVPEINRAQLEPQVPQHERMSSEELGNLLAAVGNGEQKALLISVMSLHPQSIFAGYDMRREMARAQGLSPAGHNTQGWVESDITFENYCESSFSQIGLVSQTLKDRQENIYGYQITQKGLTDGVALAGILLDYSQRHQKALRDIFSETSSHGFEREVEAPEGDIAFKNRAPFNRVKLLKTLLALPLPARVSDVTYQMIGLDRETVSEHCRALAENGIITFKTAPKEGSRVEYCLNDGKNEVSYHPKLKKLSRDTYGILSSQPGQNWTSSMILEKLIANEPARHSQTALKDSLRQVLGWFKKEGVVITPNFTNEARTSISLSDDQRKDIDELMQLLEKFQSRDFVTLSRGKEIALEYATTPYLARAAMERARNASSHAQQIPWGEMKDAIISAVGDNPGTTVDWVTSYLRHHFDLNIQPSTVRNHLGRLRQEGVLQSSGKIGAVMHWKLV